MTWSQRSSSHLPRSSPPACVTGFGRPFERVEEAMTARDLYIFAFAAAVALIVAVLIVSLVLPDMLPWEGA
jgi:hypothetical protein